MDYGSLKPGFQGSRHHFAMKSHKGLRKQLKKPTGSGAASRGEVNTAEHSPSKKSDSTPKNSPALPTEAAGDVSHPSPNRIPLDDNAATLPPQEHTSPPTNSFNSASSGLATYSEENSSASTYMTPRSLNEFLDIQLGKKNVRTFDSTAPGEATPSSTSQRGLHHTMRQSYEPSASSNSPTQDTDVVEHPFKSIPPTTFEMEAYQQSRKKITKFVKPTDEQKSTVRRRRTALRKERKQAEEALQQATTSKNGLFARFRSRKTPSPEDNPKNLDGLSPLKPLKAFANKKLSALKARFATRMPAIATLFRGLLKSTPTTGTPATLTPEPLTPDEEEEYQHDARPQTRRVPSGGLLTAVRAWECCQCGGTTGYNNYFCPECGKKRCANCLTTHEPFRR
ncbi:hypothetical protein IWX49DRAFT_634511 [Phyllosticta citricarpa]